MKGYTQVVAGVNIKYVDNVPHVLLGLKPSGIWEFPGGKIEGNESHKVALEREWIEELGVEVNVLEQRVGHGLSGTYEIWFYEVEITEETIAGKYGNEPINKEHIEVRYYSIDEAMELSMNKVNKAVLSRFN